MTEGTKAPDLYSGIPATARFSLSSPTFAPRVRRPGPIWPFTFLTARFLEPSADALAARSELVAFLPPTDSAGRAELMRLPRQRSWGSVLEAFVRHRGRKCRFDGDGRMVRRHASVRKSNLVGLGKEGTKLAARMKLGKAAAADPAVFIDWKKRLLAMRRAEARRVGLPWATIKRWKK